MVQRHPRLLEIVDLAQKNHKGWPSLNRRQQDAIEIVRCAETLDGMVASVREGSDGGLGHLHFRGEDYTIVAQDSPVWLGYLAELAVSCGFEDGVPGAVIVAAAAVGAELFPH